MAINAADKEKKQIIIKCATKSITFNNVNGLKTLFNPYLFNSIHMKIEHTAFFHHMFLDILLLGHDLVHKNNTKWMKGKKSKTKHFPRYNSLYCIILYYIILY